MATLSLRSLIPALVLACSAALSAAADRFVPEQPWLDDQGVHINAHGGGVLFHEGAYHWFGELKEGQMSRDMTIFVDDERAYLISSSEENYTLNISLLTPDYQGLTGKYTRIFPGGHNEAPAICKPGTFIAMFDVWRPRDPIDGRYLWLPVHFEDGRIRVTYPESWSLESAAPAAPATKP